MGHSFEGLGDRAAAFAKQVFAVDRERFKRAAVVERIREVLYEVSGWPAVKGVMDESTRLHEDLELDSAERIETAMALEEEFGTALSDDEVDQPCMSTIGGIADYLMTQRGVG